MKEKTITLDPLEETAADLLQAAAIRLAERIENPKHAVLLRRAAMSLEKTPCTVGELSPLAGFLLQVAARAFAAQVTDRSHADILYAIALEINSRIHAKE